jgi:hypothetical protein
VVGAQMSAFVAAAVLTAFDRPGPWHRTYPRCMAGDDPHGRDPYDDDERLGERRALAAAVLESAERLAEQLTQAIVADPLPIRLPPFPSANAVAVRSPLRMRGAA